MEVKVVVDGPDKAGVPVTMEVRIVVDGPDGVGVPMTNDVEKVKNTAPAVVLILEVIDDVSVALMLK